MSTLLDNTPMTYKAQMLNRIAQCKANWALPGKLNIKPDYNRAPVERHVRTVVLNHKYRRRKQSKRLLLLIEPTCFYAGPRGRLRLAPLQPERAR